MPTIRTFAGTEDVTVWLTDFDVFCAQVAPNGTDGQKLQAALAHLSPVVRGCCQSVAAKVQLVTGKEWPQTWPRLRSTLIAIGVQIQRVQEEKNKARTQALIRGAAIAGGGLVVGVAMPLVFLGVLGAIGFGAGGVAAGSIAAGIQSSIGLVQAGSLFAFCQSAAAGGVAMATVTAASAGIAGTAAAAGNIANFGALKALESQAPSDSWHEGQNFVPHQDIILFLVQDFS